MKTEPVKNLLYSPSADAMTNMLKSRRLVLFLNAMLVLSLSTVTIGLIYLICPVRGVEFADKFETVLITSGLSIALRNSVLFKDYHGKIVSLGLLLVSLSFAIGWLIFGIYFTSYTLLATFVVLFSVLLLALAVLNSILVFWSGLYADRD